MVLFHGTSSKFLRKIMLRGLQARSVTGVSVYNENLLSHPQSIYLTDIYALHFGQIAVEKYGGNILVVRVNTQVVLPDTDFQEGGLHSLRYEDSEWENCLAETGCVRTIDTIMPDKLYVVPKKLAREIEASRISTGFRHSAFYKMYEEQLHYVLMRSKQYVRDGQEWEIC